MPYHVMKMVDMLRDHVLHHSFTKATATMETVTMAMDQVPEILRVVGMGILTSDPSSYKEVVVMFKYLLSSQPQHMVRACDMFLCEGMWYVSCHMSVQQRNQADF